MHTNSKLEQTGRTPLIPFFRPTLGEEEKEAVCAVLESGWLSSGRYVEEFEGAFRDYLGVPFARAVHSATAGLHLALRCAGVEQGTGVITTPYTYISTAEAIGYLCARPIFVDIDPNTLNVNPNLIAEVLERAEKRSELPGISAVLPVHFGGRLCPMKEMMELSKAYSIPVVEDAAHAFPARAIPSDTEDSIAGKPAGSFGTAGVFSLYASKTITAGEGGMVITESKEIADAISRLRLHGIDRATWERYEKNKLDREDRGKGRPWDYDVAAPGYKYNMADLNAAIGLEQLKKADTFWQRRRDIARYYHEHLGDLDSLVLPELREDHSWHMFVLRIVPEMLKVDRDGFSDFLLQRGVETAVHYKPLHIMSYYRKTYGYKPEDFPESLKAFQTCFSLPIYPGLKKEQLERVVEAIREGGRRFRR